MNEKSGGVKVTGGTIIGKIDGVYSTIGPVIIGTPSGGVSTTVPEIKGERYGITSANGFEFYDGILMGKTAAINGDVNAKVTKKETNYGVQLGTKDGYKSAILVEANYSDGTSCYTTLKEAFEKAASGSTITVLRNVDDNTPATVSEDKSFKLDLNGFKISVDNTNATKEYSFITNKGTLELLDIKGNGSIELTASLASGSANIFSRLVYNQKTLTVTSGTYKVNTNSNNTNGGFWSDVIQNLAGSGIANINGGTIENNGVSSSWSPAIIADGIVNINEGVIKSSSHGAIHNNNYNKSTININGGEISGKYGIILSNASTPVDAGQNHEINISGNNTKITGTTIGIYIAENVRPTDITITGGTITGATNGIYHGGNEGNLVITSGTVKATNGAGIYKKNGEITLGIKGDGKVSVKDPVIQGTTYAIDAVNGFNFYDGILKGITEPYNGKTLDLEENYRERNSTETINELLYNTAYLGERQSVIMLMERDSDAHMIGALRSKKPQYTADLVRTITLLNSSEVPADAVDSWDASFYYRDENVFAWIKQNKDDNTKYDLYIGGNEKIIAPPDCEKLFANYKNCISITGFKNFSTSQTESMANMFNGLTTLPSLDLSNLDTTNATNMNGMFRACNKLKSVLLGTNFDKINGNDMFSGCTSLTSIITLSDEPMTLGNLTGLGTLTNTNIYVKNEEIEKAYESAENYGTLVGNERIRPILELIGNKLTKVIINKEYIEPGVTVAGFNKDNEAEYTNYGFTVKLPDTVINTGILGETELTYSVYYKGEFVMSVTRTVRIVDIPTLMERSREYDSSTGDYNYYAIGADRAEKFQYTADKIKSITLLDNDNVPKEAVDYWDASMANDESVLAWIIPNESNPSMYDLYIGGMQIMLAPENASYLFAEYENCESISNLNNINTNTATNMSHMFSALKNVESIDVSTLNTDNVVNMAGMFRGDEHLTTLDVNTFNTEKVTNISMMFENCLSLTSLNVNGINTSAVINMSNLFNNCKLLTSIDVSKFNTSNVANMSYMFGNMEALTELTIDNFDTRKTNNMGHMFDKCSNLTKIDVSHFNTENVTNFGYMFNGCRLIQNINVTNFNTDNAVDMSYMFAQCNAAKNIDVSKFNTSNVENISYMFYYCRGLEIIDLNNFNTSKVNNMNSMFNGCTNLSSVHLGKEFGKLNGENMFANCGNLQAVITRKNIDTSDDAITLGLSTKLETLKNAMLFVPSKDDEILYEEGINYESVFGATRIRPVLEVAGDNPTVLVVNDEYIEKGALVGGFDNTKEKFYAPYGYSVSIDGEVDTTTAGIYRVNYTLTYTNPLNPSESYIVMRDTRTIVVNESPDKDKTGPELTSLMVTNLKSGSYSVGTKVEITASFSESLSKTRADVPVLEIVFGNGNSIRLQTGEIREYQIVYTYVIKMEDLGLLRSISYVGQVYDIYNNMSEISYAELTGNQIVARTGVILNNDNGEDIYLPTLADALKDAKGKSNIKMLLDEEVENEETVTQKHNVVLDLNGKVVSMKLKNEAGSLITNYGILEIVDTALNKGSLSLSSSAGNGYVVTNEGQLIINGARLIGNGLGTGEMHGIFNRVASLLTVKDGEITSNTEESNSYAIFNEGETTIDGGVVNSSISSKLGYAIYNNVGSVIINGGNIVSNVTTPRGVTAYGIYNVQGFITLGVNDQIISKDVLNIYSATQGIESVGGMLEFYDGLVNAAANRSVSVSDVRTPSGYTIIKEIQGSRELAYIGLDEIPPVITLEKSTNEWVNTTVDIYVTVSDVGSGVQTLRAGGNVLELKNNKATLTVDTNGTYEFEAIDFSGNSAKNSITITNIDKTLPTISNVTVSNEINMTSVEIKFQATDNDSGIYGYAIQNENNTQIPTTFKEVNVPVGTANLTAEISLNGKYNLYVRDVAGNVAKYDNVIVIETIDTTRPTIDEFSIIEEGNGFSNSSTVILNLLATDDLKVKDVLISNTILTQTQLESSDNWVPYSEKILWKLPVGDKQTSVYAWVRDGVGRISTRADATTNILAQYIGQEGSNETSFKFLIKDENYNFNNTLQASDIKIRVRALNTLDIVYESNYGEGIKVENATPITYGPLEQGEERLDGRYYTITAKNITGNGMVYVVINSEKEKDKAGNKLSTDASYELITDVRIELTKPEINVSSSQISVRDADGHSMGYIKINGQSIPLTNGAITTTELQNKYNIVLTSGTRLETTDKCGNTTVKIL